MAWSERVDPRPRDSKYMLRQLFSRRRHHAAASAIASIIVATAMIITVRRIHASVIELLRHMCQAVKRPVDLSDGIAHQRASMAGGRQPRDFPGDAMEGLAFGAGGDRALRWVERNQTVEQSELQEPEQRF